MKPQSQAPAPGVHAGVPFETYHAWDACSHSRLTRLARSPAHLCAHLDGQVDDDTRGKTLGRLLHSAVLEPEHFMGDVLRGPEGDGRLKATRERKAAMEREHPDAVVVSFAEYDRVVAMREKLLAHPTVEQLLERATTTDAETSLVWKAAEGVICKARVDLALPQLGTLMDLKTSRDARPDEFAKTIANLGYHRQAAHYLDGGNATGLGTFDLFTLVVIETEAPHEVAVYCLDAETLEVARKELAVLKRRYTECIESGQWPGYPEEIQPIGLPAWAKPKADPAPLELVEAA